MESSPNQAVAPLVCMFNPFTACNCISVQFTCQLGRWATFLRGHRESLECWKEILTIEIFPQIILALVWGKSLSIMHLTGLLHSGVTEIDMQ